MKLGRVIDNLWTENKVEQLHACRFHIVQPVDSNLQNVSRPLVVADPQNIAGINDIIVYVTSADASQAFDSGFAPVDASVVELVDSID
ncbi:MAG: EutN/CcmL family microcompartment protein [Phycisphaerae bacterium]|nr:EutN/CcmL family microcompartment protein [Phycisphaerae bacterium]